MALFSRKKEEIKESVPAAKKAVLPAAASDRNLEGVLLKPRITEKAVKQNENNVYTFNVHKNATKFQVRDAIVQFYKVTPVKVNIVNKKPRSQHSRTRGRMISEAGSKKAYVYLKSGDTINVM